MSFEFRPVLTIASAAALALLVSLGVWQLKRLQWKNELIAHVEVRTAAPPVPFIDAWEKWRETQDTEYLPVYQKGVYRYDLEAHVFGVHAGAPGYFIFTPLEVNDGAFAGGTFVYVNRGFAPVELKARAPRFAGEPAGEVTVRGLFRRPEKRRGVAALVAPLDDAAGNIWHARDPARFAEAAGVEALPVYIDSFGEESAGPWPRGGVTRLAFSNRHLEYALTWFGLAAALIAVWLAFSLRRR